MAWLEKRSGRYRIAFRFDGQKLACSLKTAKPVAAQAALARFEDNLRRLELGLLVVPDDVDVAKFLLSDGKATAMPKLPAVRTLDQLFKDYIARIPEGSMERSTLAGMEIHIAHLKRLLGRDLCLTELSANDLQTYIAKRSQEDGRGAKRVSPATVKKELVTLRTAWNWARHMSLIERVFPNRGLKFGKLSQKPPFLSLSEVERRLARIGLTADEKALLWESVFLSRKEIDDLLKHVKLAARQPFVYPMFVFAAHTGARRSEMIRSSIDDIDFESKTVLIQERKRIRGKHSSRRVPLSDTLHETLQQWLSIHPGSRFTFAQPPEVVRSKKERTAPAPLSTYEAHDHFHRALRGSRFEKLSGWHVFRHSFCSNCAARGVDQRIINAWVGHQTEEMVQRYRHLLPNQNHEAMNLVFG